ncbi:MAG: hypothetical protein ACLFQV_07425 [Vulcanimicrobiota bacterium]
MALNTPMKIVLTVVLIALIGVGFFLLDYQKKLNEIESLEDTYKAKVAQLETNEQRVKALPEQIKRKERLEAELNALIQQKLPKEDAAIFVPKFIQEMEDLIAYEKKVTGDPFLQVNKITPGELIMPTEGGGDDEVKALMIFPKQSFQVEYEAKFSTVIHFLHQLAALRLERLITIDKISLSGKGGSVGESPRLKVSMPMIAYLNEEKTEMDEVPEDMVEEPDPKGGKGK